MEITLDPPQPVLWIAIGLPVFVTLLTLLKSVSWWKRAFPIAIAVVISAVLLKVAYTPRSFAWSDAGITDDTFGKTRTLAWTDVRDAHLVPDVWGGPYRPTLRTNGAAYDVYRAGEFRLANGATMRVFLMTGTRDALLVSTRDGEQYLYGPDHFDAFLAAASAHVTVGRD